jgi:hypothetical protein
MNNKLHLIIHYHLTFCYYKLLTIILKENKTKMFKNVQKLIINNQKLKGLNLFFGKLTIFITFNISSYNYN